MSNESDLFVVGIGASAGGVETLEKLFTDFPEDLDMAIVIVQHLSPDFVSLMPQILSRKTNLKVQPIKDQLELKPNEIFVLPTGMDAWIEDGKLRTNEFTEKTRHYHPIDLFFTSLAESYGANSIGIVLSGTGSDGSNGLKEIHKLGGLVFVQSEYSAKFNGMPRAAISTGVADMILAIEEIPDALRKVKAIAHVDGKERKKSFLRSLDVENRILELLHLNFGVNFEQYKSPMVKRRIDRRVTLLEKEGLSQYVDLLEESPEERQQLYDDLLIGVTEFFRDPIAFEQLQYEFLPKAIENAIPDEEFRVWVTPCATGEEAYSIAILIDELIQQREYPIKFKIFATDVNEKCIETASKGIYQDHHLANVSKQRRDAYFREVEKGKYKIDGRIRQSVVFAAHDVLRDAPFTKLHLVSCRNLLIYFKPPAKKKTLSLFNFSLLDDGLMFLGPSETITEIGSVFELLDGQTNVYQKTAPIRFSEVEMRLDASTKPKTPDPATGHEGEQSQVQGSELLPLYNSLLSEFVPPGFLVDEKNEILHVFGDAAKFLQFREGIPSNNLSDLLTSELSVPVMNGLKRAKIEEDQTVSFPLVEAPDGSSYRIEIRRIEIQRIEFRKENFLVNIQLLDEENLESENEIVEADIGSQDIIRDLENELRETREHLQNSISNMKTTSEEMQSTNEELIAANEELQSTNEELHSVNEELYTVNSEHQRKISELTELTYDMDNLLDSIRVDTIFLDRNLRVRKFTLGIAQTFKLLPQDVGREFRHSITKSSMKTWLSKLKQSCAPKNQSMKKFRTKAETGIC